VGSGVPSPCDYRGLGRASLDPPAGSPKWILCIFEVRKKPPGTPFSDFFSATAGPPNVAGPAKIPPISPPLNGPDSNAVSVFVARASLQSYRLSLAGFRPLDFFIRRLLQYYNATLFSNIWKYKTFFTIKIPWLNHVLGCGSTVVNCGKTLRSTMVDHS